MGIQIPKFGLNRNDTSSISAFATDVARAEEVGWDCAFLPDSQLRRRDTYVLLSAAAQSTSEITIGTLVANPVTRHPSVTASSIATDYYGHGYRRYSSEACWITPCSN